MNVIEVQHGPFPNDLACTFNYRDGRSSTVNPPSGGLVYLAMTDAFLTESKYRNIEAEMLGIAALRRVRGLKPDLLRQVPNGVKQIQSRERDGLKTAVDYLIQMEAWSKTHKIAGDWKHKRSTKPIGIWLKKILRLCERCHTYARIKGYRTPYRDSVDWFCFILRDFFSAGITAILVDLYPEKVLFDKSETLRKLSKGKGRNTKRFNDLVLNAVCSMAKELEPTHPAYPDWAFNRLLCTAFEAAQDKKSNDFRKETYAPFIQSWRDMIRETSELSITVRLEEGENFLLEQCGRGRDLRKLKTSTPEKPVK